MRDPNLVPWDYPEYFAMLRGKISCKEEDDFNDYDNCDSDSDDDDCDDCPRCEGRGCNWCLMTEW